MESVKREVGRSVVTDPVTGEQVVTFDPNQLIEIEEVKMYRYVVSDKEGKPSISFALVTPTGIFTIPNPSQNFPLAVAPKPLVNAIVDALKLR